MDGWGRRYWLSDVFYDSIYKAIIFFENRKKERKKETKKSTGQVSSKFTQLIQVSIHDFLEQLQLNPYSCP